jgi:hypothetical protein
MGTPFARTAAVTLGALFSALGGLHVYWLAGGTFGVGVVLPTAKRGGPPLFRPSATAKLAVAIALLLAGALAFAATSGQSSGPIRTVLAVTHGAVVFLFGARAVGDFRYLGVFKRIKDTRFAIWDTRLFVPLCFAIALLSGVVSLDQWSR